MTGTDHILGLVPVKARQAKVGNHKVSQISRVGLEPQNVFGFQVTMPAVIAGVFGVSSHSPRGRVVDGLEPPGDPQPLLCSPLDESPVTSWRLESLVFPPETAQITFCPRKYQVVFSPLVVGEEEVDQGEIVLIGEAFQGLDFLVKGLSVALLETFDCVRWIVCSAVLLGLSEATYWRGGICNAVLSAVSAYTLPTAAMGK